MNIADYFTLLTLTLTCDPDLQSAVSYATIEVEGQLFVETDRRHDRLQCTGVPANAIANKAEYDSICIPNLTSQRQTAY